MEDQQKRDLRKIGESEEETKDNERDDSQGNQLPAEERPEFAVGDEVVDAFEGIEKGRADDVADGLESCCCDWAYFWHDRGDYGIIRRERGGGRGIGGCRWKYEAVLRALGMCLVTPV